jgi:alpha-mannosidase
VERPTHTNTTYDQSMFEVCAHKWTDLSENRFGVALLNDCKYGVSIEGSDIRLSLHKGGTHPDPRGDEGVHEVTYSLLPHQGGFSVETVIRPAYELNVQPVRSRAFSRQRDVAKIEQCAKPGGSY